MASLRNVRRKMCDGKVPHETEDSAWAAMKHLLRSVGDVSWHMNVYKCKFCHKWHFGHSPKKYSGKRHI